MVEKQEYNDGRAAQGEAKMTVKPTHCFDDSETNSLFCAIRNLPLASEVTDSLHFSYRTKML